MVRKYITRDFTEHKRSVEYLGDDDEYIKFEIFSFDPKYKQIFLPETGSLKGENARKTEWKSWACFQSKDKINPMEFTVPYSVKETGDYRIDIVYEKNNKMYSDSKNKAFNTGKNLVGWYDIYKKNSKSEHKATVYSDINPSNAPKSVIRQLNKNRKSNAITEANSSETDRPNSSVRLKFEGRNNVIKRKVIFKHLEKGKYNFECAVPHNCYMFGIIIRKIRKYWGTNTDEAGSNLQFTNADFSISEMVKASEGKVTVGYDNDFVCWDNASGFYINYMDECNLVVKNNEGKNVRMFGGYITSILPDADMKTIDIHCADRLKDGEAKYILDQLVMQDGTGEESEYPDSISFDTYPQLLEYLCDLYEVTLDNNIDSNYLIEGEKFSEGKVISFGKNKKKTVSSIKVTNGKVTINKNSATLRNNPSGKKKQVWTLYKVKSGKTPTDISKYKNLHITYGLGNPRTEHKSKETTTVDVASSTAGSQKFGKCGVSADKKYIMGIGQRGVGRSAKTYPYGTYYQSIFKNKCPYCGKPTLKWDSCRSDSKCIRGGTKRHFPVPSNETEITCESCDCDFDVPTGYSKEGKYKYKLTKVGSTKKSSKAEQTKLHKGKMVAIPKSKEAISANDIFKAIKNACKGWKHSTGTGTTASYLEKHGVGDCWAWSDWISKQLKKYKVNHKILQEKRGTHRSVVYLNKNGKYVSFPYRKYNFPNGTYDTSGSRNGNTHYHYKAGGRISQAATTGSSTKKTQTTEITTTKGYDKDKPFQGYLDIEYSTEPSTKAKKYHVYVDFTQIANSQYTISGLKPVWVNNASKKITLTDFMAKLQRYRNHSKVYLQSIKMVTPKIVTKTKDESTDWYTSTKSNIDNSSCKILLYQIAFNNQRGVQPAPLESCGKSVNELLKTVINDTGYIVEMTYGVHRKDDKIHFRVNNNSTPTFYAQEGDNNNILEWGSITYSPVNDMRNMSMCVFKGHDQKYHYVDSRYPSSIMEFQEQCILLTNSEEIGEREAYWNARHNEKYNAEQTYSFTITVKGFPDVKLADLVEVTANAKKLNTIKEVESIGLKYSNTQKPVIQTELGLGELAPDIQVTKNIRKLRDNAKEKSTYFSRSASPVTNPEIYEWEQ